MGRRKLSDTEKRNELIVVRTTRREKIVIKALAKKNQMKVSEYILKKVKTNNVKLFNQ
jgi:hypothetical protein